MDTELREGLGVPGEVALGGESGVCAQDSGDSRATFSGGE